MVSTTALMDYMKLVHSDLVELKSKVRMPPKEIFTYAETMELLGCSRNTLDRLRKEGLLKTYSLRGKLYCKYSEIMAMLEESDSDDAEETNS